MIRFLLKGLIRDKSRSRLPVIVVCIGVMLSVFMHAYVNGIMGDTIEMNARFNTGHLKVLSRAYYENIHQRPIDLSLESADSIQKKLKLILPEYLWYQRIQFGGLLDVPDKNGETRSQGPFSGLAIDILSGESDEPDRLNLKKSIVRGSMPIKESEVLLSEKFSRNLKVSPGDTITIISSTIDGAMCMMNYTISGTLRFGSEALDRGSLVCDIKAAKQLLDMQGACSEIVGFYQSGYYDDYNAGKAVEIFNSSFPNPQKDEYLPMMLRLKDQGSMSEYVSLSRSMSLIITLVFMLAMSLVLWNAGLLGGLRRYGEFGIRLAIGESKHNVFRTLITESLIIGILGTLIGTAIGLFFAYLLQEFGINISDITKGTSVMLPSVLRARITETDFYIGFFPGIVSTLLGSMLSGIGIYKRQTSKLFKELES